MCTVTSLLIRYLLTLSLKNSQPTNTAEAITFTSSGRLDKESPYYATRHGLSIVNDVLLFRDRIVIPPSLQQRLISIVHEGHQGIVRTKQRLRQKVWWPGLNHNVESFIQSCHGCQVVGPLPSLFVHSSGPFSGPFSDWGGGGGVLESPENPPPPPPGYGLVQQV